MKDINFLGDDEPRSGSEEVSCFGTDLGRAMGVIPSKDEEETPTLWDHLDEVDDA